MEKILFNCKSSSNITDSILINNISQLEEIDTSNLSSLFIYIKIDEQRELSIKYDHFEILLYNLMNKKLMVETVIGSKLELIKKPNIVYLDNELNFMPKDIVKLIHDY